PGCQYKTCSSRHGLPAASNPSVITRIECRPGPQCQKSNVLVPLKTVLRHMPGIMRAKLAMGPATLAAAGSGTGVAGALLSPPAVKPDSAAMRARAIKA